MSAFARTSSAIDVATLVRGIAAGFAWGVTVAAALLALAFHQWGTICLAQIVDTMGLSIAAGILTIGPLALLRRRAQASVQ